MQSKTEVKIPFDGITLEAFLTIPDGAKGLVIFAHGSGSSRFSYRNNYVAEALNKHCMATLLVDLLTEAEDKLYANRFKIPLLTKRLICFTNWSLKHQALKNLPIGYFGASTGAAPSINAAAELKNVVKAIVSRGGRPDLAKEAALLSIKTPVLLIIGSEDHSVIELNKQAFEKLTCLKEMIIIEGASHLFEELGKMQDVINHSIYWFEKNLFTLPIYAQKEDEFNL